MTHQDWTRTNYPEGTFFSLYEEIDADRAYQILENRRHAGESPDLLFHWLINLGLTGNGGIPVTSIGEYVRFEPLDYQEREYQHFQSRGK